MNLYVAFSLLILRFSMTLPMTEHGICVGSPRTTFVVRFSCGNVFPGYAKTAYPGLMFLHASGVASPEGCRELSPGWSVLCDTRG